MTVLWDHQSKAVDAITAAFQDAARAQVVMACGTGKTVVGAETSGQTAAAGRVLIIVPTLDLLAQTARAYHAHLGEPAGRFIGVCSDIHTLRHHVGDDTLQEIRNLGAVTTDPAELADLISQAAGRLTVLTTYDSMHVVAAAHTAGAPAWDLAVVDEAHRSAGRVGRAWSIIHDDAQIPADRRLYLTATPRVMNSERYETVSMDDEGVFGREVYRLPFAEAIGRGLLADYRLVVAVVTSSEVAALASGKELVRVDGRTVPAAMLAAQIAMLKACREHGLSRVITYHHRVLSAVRFAATLPNAAALLPADEEPARPVYADYLTGQHDTRYRRAVLTHLDHPGERIVVISNARVLGEGVDVPELDGVMFTDPRDSTTDVVQAVGRALRKGATGTKVATIIVPILLNDAESAEAALQGSKFDAVYRVVRALRAHDERLADWLDEHRVAGTTHDKPETEQGPHELPKWLHVSGTAITEEFARALLVRTVRLSTSSWVEPYAQARAYHAEHGHLEIPVSYMTPTGLMLGSWVANQRSRRRIGNLSVRQIELLDEIGMVWNTLDAAWETGIVAARAYRAEHGNLLVPTRYVAPDGYQLGAWLTAARNRHNEGKLPAGRAADLEALGVQWNLFNARWEHALKAARAYHTKHGHLEISQNYVDDGGLTLGTWLTNQRAKHRAGKLSAEQVAALDELGIDWNPKDSEWERCLAEAAAFHIEHGHLNIPKGYRTPAGMDLPQWVQERRAQYREGGLPADRIAALEAIGMVWDPHVQGWRDGLAAATSFAMREGHLSVPAGHLEQALNLHSWIGNRRSEYRQGILAADRIAALEAIGMVWDPHVQDWRDGLADCQDFSAAHGHLDIRGKAAGTRIKALGSWVARRRKEYHDGELAPDRAAALTELGMQWEDSRTRSRKQGEQEIRAFHAANGHANVPALYVTAGGFKLGMWLSNKRSSAKRGAEIHPETLAVFAELGVDLRV